TAITDDSGRFNLPRLPVGRYELTAELQGFTKYVRSPINLLLNQVAVVDPELRPSAAPETVVVTEDSPLLNTSTSEVGVRLAHEPVSGGVWAGRGLGRERCDQERHQRAARLGLLVQQQQRVELPEQPR